MDRQLLLDPSGVQPITCGIYAIKNGYRVVYVGHSAEIPVRLKRHKSRLRKGEHRNPHLQNSWNKYGPEAFEFYIIEECAVELLIEREQHYMDQYSDLYNVLPASGSRLGIPHTPEARAKIGAAARGRGRTLSPEARAKIGEANRRRVVSDETKSKTSASLKAYWERRREEEAFDAVGAMATSSSKVGTQTKPASSTRSPQTNGPLNLEQGAIMATKTFTTYKPTEDQFIELDDVDGNIHKFKLNPALPGKVILDFMFVSGSDDSSKLAASIKDVLDKAIVAEDKEAWETFSEDPRNGVTISVLSEVVGHITSVLSGNPQAAEV